MGLFAFCFNIANKYTHSKLYDIMIKEFGVDRDERTTYPNVAGCNLITGVYLREEFLFRENEHARMLDELKTIFYPMAEKIGTLTEGYCTGMDYSDNHGLTACTANWIVKAVSGFNSKRMGEYEFLPTHVDYGCEIEIPMLDKTIKFSK